MPLLPRCRCNGKVRWERPVPGTSMRLKGKQTAVNVTQTYANMNRVGESNEPFWSSRRNRALVKHFNVFWGGLSPQQLKLISSFCIQVVTITLRRLEWNINQLKTVLQRNVAYGWLPFQENFNIGKTSDRLGVEHRYAKYCLRKDQNHCPTLI